MATLRNPGNAIPVIDGQVLVSFADDPKIGKDGTFGPDWYTVGILKEGSKVEIQKAIEKNKAKGWGFGVIAVSTKPGDLTASCETLEENEATRRIQWPTAKDHVLYHDGIVARCHVAMVSVRADGSTNIKATRYKAYATMEDVGFQEEVDGRKIDFDFIPGANKDVFDEWDLKTSQSAPTNAQLIRFVDATQNDPNNQPGGAKPPTPAANTVAKKVTLPNGVTGGTWSLSVGSQKLTGLAFDITADDLKTKVAALSGLSDVSVTGDNKAGYIVKATGADSISADGSGLTGGASTDIQIADPN